MWSVCTYRTNPKNTSGHGTLRKHLGTEHSQDSSPAAGDRLSQIMSQRHKMEALCLCPRLYIYTVTLLGTLEPFLGFVNLTVILGTKI